MGALRSKIVIFSKPTPTTLIEFQQSVYTVAQNTTAYVVRRERQRYAHNGPKSEISIFF
jgi:hypothetical protein